MPGQRLLTQIDLFENPGVVLEDPKYWNPDFARCFIEAWDGVAFDDPRAGFRLANIAVELAGRLEHEVQGVLRPRALATVGSSHRALQDLSAAESVLAEVAALQTETLVPRLDEADFYRRMTYMRADQKRWSDAIGFADKCIVLCQAEQAWHELGRAYGARGAVLLKMKIEGESVPTGEPIASLCEALKRVDASLGPHTYEAPMSNLALALLEGYSCNLEWTISMLQEAVRRQAHRRITRKTEPNAHLRWTLGLAYFRIGTRKSLHRASELLRRARLRLMEIGVSEKVVHISLDLGRVYSALGQWGRLRLVAEEILSIEGGYTREALAALQAWRSAIVREQIPKSVWKQVLDKVRWSPLNFPKEQQRRPIRFVLAPRQDAPPLW